MDKKKKVALVTGAAQGIGLSIAKALANHDIKVVMTDVSENKLMEEVDYLKNSGLEVEGYLLDVSNELEVKTVISQIKKVYNRLDILVNNAAISPKVNGNKRLIVDIPLDEWNQVMNVNLTGSFLCVRESLPLMMQNNWGRIVNLTSQAGRTYSRVAASHYSTSKTALIGLTRNIAFEYGQYRITANCIAPGRIDSPMVNLVSKETNEKFKEISPLKRLGKDQEIAAAVLFLCSEDAGYITGATLDVNGGMFMG